MDNDQLVKIVAAIIAVIGMYFGLTTDQQTQIAAALVAVIGAVIAYYQTTQKANLTAALTDGTKESVSPAIISSLPSETWKMLQETKDQILKDLTERERTEALEIIQKYETWKNVDYVISVGGFEWHISYGLIKSFKFDALAEKKYRIHAEITALTDANNRLLDEYFTLPDSSMQREYNARYRQSNNEKINKLLEQLTSITGPQKVLPIIEA